MKYCVEFGVIGGAHVDNYVVQSRRAAHEAVRAVMHVMSGYDESNWVTEISADNARQTWKSDKHFAAMSRLDGVARGPASATLWRKTASA